MNTTTVKPPTRRPGRPIAPLHDPRTRVILLANSYLDAAEGVDDGGRGSKPQSRMPGRNPELWPYGSYAELERLLDELRAFNTTLSNAFWKAHVRRVRPEKASERDAAYHATGWLAKRMPASIFVPVVISVTSGYSPAEARAYGLRRDPFEAKTDEAA